MARSNIKSTRAGNGSSFRSRVLKRLSGPSGAIDLASIMVGVLVIGVIGGVIGATVTSVIPWSQNEATKGSLSAVQLAQSVAKVKHGTYMEIPDLISNGYLPSGAANLADSGPGGGAMAINAVGAVITAANGVTKPSGIATGVGIDGDCYVAAAVSQTGAVFYTTSKSVDIFEYEDGATAACTDLAVVVASAVTPVVADAADNSAVIAALNARLAYLHSGLRADVDDLDLIAEGYLASTVKGEVTLAILDLTTVGTVAHPTTVATAEVDIDFTAAHALLQQPLTHLVADYDTALKKAVNDATVVMSTTATHKVMGVNAISTTTEITGTIGGLTSIPGYSAPVVTVVSAVLPGVSTNPTLTTLMTAINAQVAALNADLPGSVTSSVIPALTVPATANLVTLVLSSIASTVGMAELAVQIAVNAWV